MRIHRLRMRGVGPFLSEFTIDFDALGERKLFLIEGVTGAGKSTIIDAIVFALYGHSSEAAAKSRMVSHFIGDTVPKEQQPFVELVFSVESGVYRVFREPESEYINRNGKRSMRTSTVRLERLASELAEQGEMIANRIQEGNREVEQRVGLDASQFHATIVLAQGKFARFLKATSEERQQILEKVFGTQGYAKAQLYLDRQAREARDRRQATETSLRSSVSRFLQAAGVPDPDNDWPTLMLDEPEVGLERAQEQVELFSGAASKAAAAADATSKILEQAQAAEQSAKSLAEQIQRKNELLRRQQELEAQHESIERLRAALDRDAQARAVKPAIDSFDKATRERDDAGEAWNVARQSVPVSDSYLLDLPDDDLRQALENSLQSISEEFGGIEKLVELEQQIPQLRSDEGDAEAAVKASRKALTDLESRRKLLPVKIEEVETSIEKLSAQVQRTEDIDSDLENFKEGAEAAARVSELSSQHKAAKRELRTSQDHFEKQSRHLIELERLFSESLASQVARGLQDGSPCPVCGSLEHPQPAQRVDDIDQDVVEEARTEAEHRRKELDQARQSVTDVEVALATARAQAKNRTEQEWNADIARAESQRRESEEAAKNHKKLSERRNDLKAEQEGLGVKYEQELQNSEQAKARLESAGTTLKKALGDVEDAKGEFASVNNRRDALHARRDALKKLNDEMKRVQQARSNLAQAQALLLDALENNGFSDLAECRDALIDDTDVAQWRSDVKNHDNDLLTVGRSLQEEPIKDIDPETVVDLDVPAAQVARAKGDNDDAVREKNVKSEALKAVTTTLDSLHKEVDKYRDVHRETADVIRMAELASGRGANTRGIPLATYVILRRFEEVVAAANIRLNAISDGRYGLQADIEQRDGRKVARGLGLSVLDRETDKAREVGTLSGGETFYTSLSLALGLADVVQGETGGVQLGTLFIDEGFGSLDGDTLDAVMDVLHQLTRGDRVVGVISHVEEMKRAIPNRIRVRRMDNGTSVIDVPD